MEIMRCAYPRPLGVRREKNRFEHDDVMTNGGKIAGEPGEEYEGVED